MIDKTGWKVVLRIPYSKDNLNDVFYVWYNPTTKRYYSGWLENDRGEEEQITKHINESPREKAALIVKAIFDLGWSIP